jgi:hypothetical protein
MMITSIIVMLSVCVCVCMYVCMYIDIYEYYSTFQKMVLMGFTAFGAMS